MNNQGVQKVYEIKLTENELKQVIEKYIKEQTNNIIKLIIVTKKEIQFYGYETEYAKTHYYFEKEINILGLTKLARLEITEEEIKEILKNILKDYEIININFESGFEHQTQYEFATPVFKKVKILFKEKNIAHNTINHNQEIDEIPTKNEESKYNPKNTGGYYEDWSLCRKF